MENEIWPGLFPHLCANAKKNTTTTISQPAIQIEIRTSETSGKSHQKTKAEQNRKNFSAVYISFKFYFISTFFH